MANVANVVATDTKYENRLKTQTIYYNNTKIPRGLGKIEKKNVSGVNIIMYCIRSQELWHCTAPRTEYNS